VSPLFDNHQNLFDIIDSKIPDKIRSLYTQSPVEAEFIIEALTSVNDLVLDPMLGEGSTGEAAIKLRRRFIGIEIDPTTLKLAKANFLRNLK
jgi:DNA modification methylase